MSLPIRRGLDALVLRVINEPLVADLYVEGAFDVSLYEYVLKRCGLRHVQVYSIDDLDIPASAVSSDGDVPGNRDRIIAAARVLHDEVGPLQRNIRFICDRDFDDFVESSEVENPLLLRTDFTAAELYLWNRDIIERFFALYVRVQVDVDVVMASLAGILSELFIIRAASHLSGIRMGTLVSLSKVVSCSSGGLAFDREAYVSRLLNANGTSSRRLQLEDEMDKLRLAVPCAPVPVGNGHDFVELLGIYVRRCARPKTQIRDVDRGLLASLELEHIASQPTIAGLVGTFSALSEM